MPEDDSPASDVILGIANLEINSGEMGDVELTMSNEDPVAGFQFEVESSCDIEINSGTGGTASDAGFTVSAQGSVVLGFSFTGGTIPPGEGTLVELDATFSCEEGTFGLSGVVLSDIEGDPMTFNLNEDFMYYSSCNDEDACNFGEEGACEYPDECYTCDGMYSCWENEHFMVEIDETGESHLIILMDSITGLEPGDEIGVYDLNGVVETDSSGSNTTYGEVLVGAGVWDGIVNEEGAALEIVAIMSIDISDFGGPVLNGAVDGNDIMLRVYDASDSLYLDTELTLTSGGEFGDLMTVISDIYLVPPEPPIAIGDACDMNDDGMVDEGFVVDCSFACSIVDWLGDAYCDDGTSGPVNFACEYFQWDGNTCCDQETELDCLGNCFGSAVDDCNGDCDGSAVEDCAGECNGPAEYDCAMECNGSASLDECGVCEGDGTSCEVYIAVINS
jgi:hypothetical protein